MQTQKILDGIVTWIKEWFIEGGAEKAIVGISGGKDSAVVAALCVRALGAENVIGVLLPNGTQSDIHDSEMLCEFLGIKTFKVNIHNAFQGVLNAMPQDLVISDNFKTNTPSRLRMVSLYGIASCIPKSRVANTGNYDEAFCGYTTIYGDFAGDFAPISNLHVSEVCAIGDALGVPSKIVHKEPSDGMCGKTDEDNLGFTYSEVEQFSHFCVTDKTKISSLKNADKIAKRHADNKFKRNLINIPCPFEKISEFLSARE